VKCDQKETEILAMPADPGKHQEQLTGMMLDLHANQAALKSLGDWYGVFVFTGGNVPSGRSNLVAISSYLKRPFAIDRISVEEVERYRHLVETILQPEVAVAPRPRTLRCRKDLGDGVDRALAEIQTLEITLGAVLAELVKELTLPFPQADAKRNDPPGKPIEKG
jgi:hypothetical protein